METGPSHHQLNGENVRVCRAPATRRAKVRSQDCSESGDVSTVAWGVVLLVITTRHLQQTDDTVIGVGYGELQSAKFH